VCPQPSSQNKLVNAGFDTDLSGWTTDAGPGGFSQLPANPPGLDGVSGDATSCPFSGSCFVSANETSQRIWQCVSVTPQAMYNFGVQIHTSNGAYARCGVELYPGAGCTGSPTRATESEWLNVAWSPDLNQTFGTNISASAKVYCYVEGGGAFSFDRIYLSPAPGGF